MRVTTDVHLEAYLEAVDRMIALVRRAPDRIDDPVTACPAWTARQLVGHLTGLAQDWVMGNLNGYGSDEWAAAQVARFDGATVGELLSEWQNAVDRFGDLGPAPMGGTPAMWAFGDAVVHEADLRPVLAPGTRVPDQAVDLGLKAAISRWRAQLSSATDAVGPLDVVAADKRTWRIGGPEAVAAGGSVTTTGYELFRALFGRRSRSQVEGWDWTCDSTPYLDAGLPFPFRWSDIDLRD